MDAHLLPENERLRGFRTWAPTAPMPRHPLTCRWCDGRLRSILPDRPATHCDGGCAVNTSAPYLMHCDDCQRSYYTGRPMSASQCWTCEQRSKRYQPNDPTRERLTYHFERFKRGGFR